MSSDAVRQWEVWDGRQRFFCDGRLMVAPDFELGLPALVVSAATFGVWAWYVIGHLSTPVVVLGAVMYMLLLALFFITATIDPGIIPSNRINVSNESAAVCAQEQRTHSAPDGSAMPAKWCRSCRIFRPLRASHCSRCDVCIDRFDHHCPWMGSCVGGRNYRFFLGLILTISALGVHIFVSSSLVTYRALQAAPGWTPPDGCGLQHPSRRIALGLKEGERLSTTRYDWASAVLCALSRISALGPVGHGTLPYLAFVGVFTLGLWLPFARWHLQLAARNQTTKEYWSEVDAAKKDGERRRAEHRERRGAIAAVSPFSRGGMWLDCGDACCISLAPSRLMPRAVLSAAARAAAEEGLVQKAAETALETYEEAEERRAQAQAVAARATARRIERSSRLATKRRTE